MEKEFRKFCYFIENPDTNEWYFMREEWQEGMTAHDGYMGLFPDWTNDPLKAMRFESKQDAESFMKYDTVIKGRDYLITEHEFVVNKV